MKMEKSQSVVLLTSEENKLIMKKLITIYFLCFFSLTYGQNQFHIGQYAIHQPFLNPATIGVNDGINFALLYKKQWFGLEGSPNLQGANFNMPVGAGSVKKSFIGVNLINDKIGLNNSTDISGTYAYKVRTSINSRLILGVSASLNLISSKLEQASTSGAVVDPVYATNSPVYPLPNFKFGSYFYRRNFYLGFVIPNLLDNRVIVENGSTKGFVGFVPKNIHYYFHGGYKFDLLKGNSLVTSFLVKEVSGAPLQLDLNLNFMYRKQFGIGANIRSSKEAMIMLSAYVMPELLLSYGYEYGFNELNNFNSGTHELLLIYKVNGGNQDIAFPRF